MTTALYELEDETTSGEATSLEYLVEAAQAGDRDAFGELATRFEPMVYAIAVRRLGNHSEAQELCQEVLVKAMQKLEQLKVPAAFGGWLRSITVRMAINRQVRRAPMIAKFITKKPTGRLVRTFRRTESAWSMRPTWGRVGISCG